MATATQVTLIEAHPRAEKQRGKNEARRLRSQGRIPAVLYGAQKQAVPVSVDPKQITRILTSESGHNTIFDLQVGNEKTKAMIVDWQYEPIKGRLLHIDLKRIAMDERLRVKVPIILEQVLRELELECLPGDIPSHIDVDVSGLVFGQVLRVSDLPHAGKVKFLTEENQTVAHITAVKEEVAPAPEAVAEAAAAPAEPEVIKKGKQETEEGAAEAEAKAPEKPEKPEKKEKK
jgi:large subunit ribosomal protein L25